MSTKTDVSRPSTPAWRLFFPLAALHATVMVRLSLLVFYHATPQGLVDLPVAHGRDVGRFGQGVDRGQLSPNYHHKGTDAPVSGWHTARH